MADVDIWTTSLRQPPVVIERCVALLAADEVLRARQFATAQLRTRFCIARGVLRQILARYTGRHAILLKFGYGGYGKPLLSGMDLHFNLSHTDTLLALAVTRRGAVGIDVELVKSLPDEEAVARHFFAASELNAFLRMSPNARTRSFFECWTRREAFIKAIGVGVSQPRESFEVAFGPGATPRLIRFDGPGDYARNWELTSFEPAAGHIGAVAVRAVGASVRIESFRPLESLHSDFDAGTLAPQHAELLASLDFSFDANLG